MAKKSRRITNPKGLIRNAMVDFVINHRIFLFLSVIIFLYVVSISRLSVSGRNSFRSTFDAEIEGYIRGIVENEARKTHSGGASFTIGSVTVTLHPGQWWWMVAIGLAGLAVFIRLFMLPNMNCALTWLIRQINGKIPTSITITHEQENDTSSHEIRISIR